LEFFIVFTDIEGSTRLWELYPSQMFRVISRHDEIIQSACDEFGGRIVKTMGDGFFMVFEDARAADAAVAMRNACEDEAWEISEPLNIKVGINRSEIRQRQSDYYGQGINLTARLVSAAWGGQILCTGEVARSLEGHGSLSANYLGDGRLKHISQAVPLYQIEESGDRRQFPELRALVPNPCNYGAPVTPMIGREESCHDLTVALIEKRERLVTIHGPGGIGKTMLAKVLGLSLLPEYHGGVFFVEILSGASDLLSIILRDMKFPSLSSTDDLEQHLAAHRCLLILDNFEAALELKSELADLLPRFPKLQILATSRELLNLSMEARFVLMPLGYPPEESLEPIEHYDAVKLFIARAARSFPDFRVDEENSPSIAAICSTLEGIPLAIDLVASRVRSNTLDSLRLRLDKVLTLPSRISDVPERHRTLTATISWSYQLLDDAQRLLMALVSVLPGSFTADLAAELSQADPLETEDRLNELCDRSMLQAVAIDRCPLRYRSLNMVRQYVSEYGVAVDGDGLLSRAADWYLRQLGELGIQDHRSLPLHIRQQILPDEINIEFLIAGLIDSADPRSDDLLRCLGWYWEYRGRYDFALKMMVRREEQVTLHPSIALMKATILSMTDLHEDALAVLQAVPDAEPPWDERTAALSLYESMFVGTESGLFERAKSMLSSMKDPEAMLQVRRCMLFTSIRTNHLESFEEDLETYLTEAEQRGSGRDRALGLSYLHQLYEIKPDRAKTDGIDRIGEMLSYAVNYLDARNFISLNLNIADFYVYSIQDFAIALEFAQEAFEHALFHHMFDLQIWAKCLILLARAKSGEDPDTGHFTELMSEVTDLNAKYAKLICLLILFEWAKFNEHERLSQLKQNASQLIDELNMPYYARFLE
jgi:predicted ATPase/class 3 adenylate cyclase